MTAHVTGDDIDNALNLIENNGGLGEFETEPQSETPRWLFPRYWPACEKCGAQTRPDERKKAKHDFRCEACKHEQDIPDGDKYLSRSGIGHDTDVETLVSWLDAPRNVVGAVLLLGDPGTGKTALIEAAAAASERRLTTVLCTPDHTKDSLYMRFVGEGNGENGTPFTLGPLPYAAKYGHLLYCDEVMMLQDGVKPLLYSLADGRHFLPEGNVDGSPLEIHPDFRLVMSSNPTVRGASLPEPLASRCASTTLTVETDGDMLRALGIDDSIVAAWEHLKGQGLWCPQVRELRVANYWMPVNKDQAMSAFLPEHAPEAQRAQIKSIVTSYLGGDLRDDGRLVVS